MNTATFEPIDTKCYGRLLAKATPMVVKTEAENERLLAIVERLMAKGEDNLTPEEDALLELLVGLIEDFESKAYPLPEVEPHKMVAYLLEQRGLKACDLWPSIGSKGRVSDMLSGRREISKDQARKLAEFFDVGVGLFI